MDGILLCITNDVKVVRGGMLLYHGHQINISIAVIDMLGWLSGMAVITLALHAFYHTIPASHGWVTLVLIQPVREEREGGSSSEVTWMTSKIGEKESEEIVDAR